MKDKGEAGKRILRPLEALRCLICKTGKKNKRKNSFIL
jgi:hypothetical protein